MTRDEKTTTEKRRSRFYRIRRDRGRTTDSWNDDAKLRTTHDRYSKRERAGDDRVAAAATHSGSRQLRPFLDFGINGLLLDSLVRKCSDGQTDGGRGEEAAAAFRSEV
ncbi:hypothetical protein L596_025331 [Steinernema carpocapsae]|uniref:Uncharacterized protein n=1 Tax=Steinernema carpocapsae TaxID=34508 RepID=A0A4U5M7I7_STECR|nr:hypothetical protein L596_025331 [Steinernema carpocapsae]